MAILRIRNNIMTTDVETAAAFHRLFPNAKHLKEHGEEKFFDMRLYDIQRKDLGIPTDDTPIDLVFERTLGGKVMIVGWTKLNDSTVHRF